MEDRIPIFRSLEMIEENIGKKLTVEMLAESAHFSRYHYQRLFREAVGDSVMAYVSRRRLSLAAEELLKTDRTILEIALKYGYDSHEGFTRGFKAFMGVTPGEYRKYRPGSGCLPTKKEKEKSAMMYSKTTQEIIRELNGLIVQARETAAATRKEGTVPEAGAFYGRFWNYTADRAEAMADRLEKMTEEITAIQNRPDEISARFRMIKEIEDAAFEASITSFQTGLMISRAMPEQQAAFRILYDRYNDLAGNARMKSGKTAAFLQELAALIFQDMRKDALRKIQETTKAGKAAGEKLGDPGLPYGYIAESAAEIAEEISSLPLEKMTHRLLEDELVRLDTVILAKDMDLFREPSHNALFEELSEFREKLRDTTEFFGSLSEEWVRTDSVTEEEPDRMDQILFQEKILLFYLKGEIQKLRFSPAEAERTAALEEILNRLSRGLANGRQEEITELIREGYREMIGESEKMGIYGGPVRYIAEEMLRPVELLEKESRR